MLNIKKYINKHEVQFCVENIDSSLFVKLNGRYKESNMSNHILFEITDDKLLNATNGVIKGMSGSPIVQNGKLIGAVTHAIVNDANKGYGIYITTMLEEGEN